MKRTKEKKNEEQPIKPIKDIYQLTQFHVLMENLNSGIKRTATNAQDQRRENWVLSNRN